MTEFRDVGVFNQEQKQFFIKFKRGGVLTPNLNKKKTYTEKPSIFKWTHL